MAPPIANVRMPHHTWHQLIDSRNGFDVEEELASTMNDNVLEALEYMGEQLADVLVHIGIEQGHLREMMVNIFHSLCASAQSSDAALMLLPDVIVGTRDLFITQVAKLLLTHFDCTYREAIHEASLMAAQDGMCDAEFTQMAEDGTVNLDLTKTFPKAMQHKGWATRKEYILPARGLGRTELESKERAFLSIKHHIVRTWRTDASKTLVHGLKLNDNDPVDDPMGNYRDSHQKLIDILLRNGQWASVQPVMILMGKSSSPFSDGEFLLKSIKITKFIQSSNRPAGLTNLFSTRQVEYEKAWSDSLDQELNDWQGFINGHNA
ncbi:hypothetical protein FRC06_001110 [Ceratobasidium sp. 370]|nr:hypothetical protein FRC06_001110 [Ceratobasidium sp. 370]